MCVLKNIIDIEPFWIKTWQVLSGEAYAHQIIPVLSNYIGNYLKDQLPKINNFQDILNALISHVEFRMYVSFMELLSICIITYEYFYSGVDFN